MGNVVIKPNILTKMPTGVESNREIRQNVLDTYAGKQQFQAATDV